MKNSFHTIKCMISIIVFSLVAIVPAKSQNPVAQNDKSTYSLEGLVRDARTKEPIRAAQITVPNKLSAITDVNGKFTLDMANKDEILHVTAFDYGKVEYPVQGKSSVIIDLFPDNFTDYFSEVTLPTGVVDNSSLTLSARSKDNIQQNTNYSASEIIANSLGGDVRSIGRSGLVGSGDAMFIRGINSLNVNAQPLLVVDGVIWTGLENFESIHQGLFLNNFENIDVNDIENVTIMKDGTSLYGSKAANGVILINTKRAKTMVTKIGLNVFFGLIDKPELTPMMSESDFRIYASDLYQSYQSYQSSLGQSILPNAVPPFLGSSSLVQNYKYYNDTNWSKEVYQRGSISNYLINVDGGDDRAMYYFSMGYSGGDGVVKETDLQRLNARFNVDATLAKFLTTKVNVSFARMERASMDDGVDNYASPTWQAQIKSPFLSPYIYNKLGQRTQQLDAADEFGIANPSGVIDKTQNKQKKYRFNVGVTPELIISPEFTFSSQFDYSLEKFDEAYFIPMTYTPLRHIPYKGYSENRLASQVAKNNSLFSDSRLSYKKLFGNNEHSLNALIGFRYHSNSYESDFVEEHNSGANTNTMITGSYEFLIDDGAFNTTKSIATYLSADYDYKKKYFLTASMSMDASSRFGKDTDGGISLFGVSWGLFPSVEGAWLFSSETFMQPLKFLSFGKLRVGYGITGNDAIPDYESMAYLNSVRFTQRATALQIAHYENEKIQWEQTARANAGINLGMFKNRINLSFDVFKSKTDNLLTLRQLPDLVGHGYFWDNGGELKNKGYEGSLDLRALNLKNVQWELGLSVGHYKNEIASLVNPGGSFTTEILGGEVISQVGQPAGLFYGYKTNGVFATETQAQEAGLKKADNLGGFSYFGAGDVIFDDLNKDGYIDDKDKQIIGDPNPDFYGSFNTSIMVKRVKLNALFTYSYGNDVYNYYRRMLETGTDFGNQSKAMLNRWMADGQQTSQPKAVYGDPMENSRFSDRWIEDGSYLKLKNVTLSYQLPIKNDYIRGVNIWASASNLFTLTKYLGRDPEFSLSNSALSQGIDGGYLPSSRTYYLGIRIDL